MSIGAQLALARHQAGLTIAEVSQRTRIREPIIRSVERGDFAACGGDFYARGNIRALAKAAGIDPEPLVAAYDDAARAAAEEVAAQETAARQAPARPRPARPGPARPGAPPAGTGPLPAVARPRLPLWGTALIAVAAAAAGVLIYHTVSAQPPSPGAGSPAAAASHRAAARPRPSPAARSGPASPQAAPVPAGAVVISLAAGGEPCWAQLSTQAGTTVYQGVVAPGTTLNWTETQPVTLALGNPGAVTLTVNGTARTGLGASPVTLTLAPGQ